MEINELIDSVKTSTDQPLVKMELYDTGNKINIDGKLIPELKWRMVEPNERNILRGDWMERECEREKCPYNINGLCGIEENVMVQQMCPYEMKTKE